MSEKRTAKIRDEARQKVTRLKERGLERDPMARELVTSDANASENSRFPVFSTNPATNLMIADVVVRGISSMFRKNIEKRVARVGYGSDDKAREVLDGRTIATTLALYGMSKLATRSPVGLGIVASGLVAKTLYDRGKERQRRKRLEQQDGKKG